MCNRACLDFARKVLQESRIRKKRVLEISSYNYNGGVWGIVDELGPKEYIGMDIHACDHEEIRSRNAMPKPYCRGVKGRRCVDIVLSVENAVGYFGPCSFDTVICTELLEHVADWRCVIRNMKELLRDNGTVLLTTRSLGFPKHNHPQDYWRFSVEDMRLIFSDFQIEHLDTDWQKPGFFISARKPVPYVANSLEGISVYDVSHEPEVIKPKRAKEARAHL